MKIRTFPGDGLMTIETTPAELRSIADRLDKGEVMVQIEEPGQILVGVKLDEDYARTLPHASKVKP